MIWVVYITAYELWSRSAIFLSRFPAVSSMFAFNPVCPFLNPSIQHVKGQHRAKEDPQGEELEKSIICPICTKPFWTRESMYIFTHP